MTLVLDDVTVESMTLQARQGDDEIVAKLAGTADTAARAPLEEFFTQLHAESVRLATKAVVVDVKELEFMNSSCLKVFVSWLAQLRELEGTQQYKVRFRSDPKLLWQRRSLAALSCFAIDLVSIET